MEFAAHLLVLVQSFVERQPAVALALGAALVSVVFTTALRARGKPLAVQLLQFGWSLLLVAFLVGAAGILKTYLNGELAEFRRTHGRVSEANYAAVQTIWGPEQNQQELTVEFGYDEEVTERVEFEDQTKPAILKKHMEHRLVPGNPFESARHEVTLRQNPRKKGSAIYPGYETQEHFTYKLRYPGERDAKATIRFPMPSAAMVANDLVVNLNGTNALGQLEIADSALVLALDVKKGWAADLEIAFKSRGVSYWYFQVSEARVIRDFELTLHLPDLPKQKLNYPEGCMTPTEVVARNGGCDLVYRLGNAVSSKGMGIALSQPAQPGKTMNAVLAETSTAWTLVFSVVVAGLTLAGARQPVLISILVGAAVAFGYGLLGNFHDIVYGFWGSAALILLPLFVALAWVVARAGSGLIASALPLFGAIYPCLAGLDSGRQPLYLNVCTFLFLALMAWLLSTRRTDSETPAGVALAGESRA